MIDNIKRYVYTYLFQYPKFSTPYTIIEHLLFCNGNGSNYECDKFHMPFYMDSNIREKYPELEKLKYVNFYFTDNKLENIRHLGKEFLDFYESTIVPVVEEQFLELASVDFGNPVYWESLINKLVNKAENDRMRKYYANGNPQLYSFSFPYTPREVKFLYGKFYIPIYDHIHRHMNESNESELLNFVEMFGNNMIKSYRKYFKRSEIIEDVFKDYIYERINNFEVLHKNIFSGVKYEYETL